MNNIVLVSGSSKIKNGASYEYLNILKKYIDINSKIISALKYNDKELKQVLECDTIVFSYPLYVDGLPGEFLKFLSFLEDKGLSNKNIYAICNLGYYESNQADVSLEILKNFTLKTNNKFMGAISIGCGPIGYKKYPLINNNIKKNLKKFGKIVKDKEFCDTIYTKCLLPRFMYIRLGNYSWNKQIKKNLFVK